MGREDQEKIEGQDIKDQISDYKIAYEQEKSRNEKISTDYKTMEARANQLQYTLAGVKGAVEANKIGKFDENWNLEIIQQQHQERQQEIKDEYEDQIKSIDDQIKELKGLNKDGDIDPDDYFDKISDLKAERKAIELDKKWKQRESEKEKKLQEKSLTQQEESKHLDTLQYLDTNYPGHNTPNSPLQQEMAAVMVDKPNIYGDIDYTKKENLKFRLALAEEAYSRMESQGKVKQRNLSQAKQAQFQTLNDDNMYDSNQAETGLSAEQKNMLVRSGITDAKLIDSLNKIANQANKNQAIYIET